MAVFHFFGRLREAVGQEKVELDLPKSISTLEELRLWVDGHFHLDGALTQKNVRIIINHQLNSSNDIITNEDEISFLPPVSGG